MSGITRFGGYLGLVFLLGGITSLLLLPRWIPEIAFESTRTWLDGAVAAGYFLVLARLAYLAFTTGGRRRWGTLLAVWLLGIGVVMLVGVSLTLRGGPA